MQKLATFLLLSVLTSLSLSANANPADLDCINKLTMLVKDAGRVWKIPTELSDIEAEDKRLEQEEAELLHQASNTPVTFYLHVRKLAKETKQLNGDFSYAIARPVLKRILLDLAKRVRENLNVDDTYKFETLIGEGMAMLTRGPYYREYFSFLFSYLDAIDTAFLRHHPELNGRFHRTNAQPVFRKLFDSGPDMLMFPSFRSVDTDHFVLSRSVPFHLVGLHTSGARPGEAVPFADGFPMMPSEFFWHDIGHIEYMWMRDEEYIKSTFKPIERVVQEWDFTRRRIVGFWQSFREDKKDLYDAMELLLFEILHERGYQYSLAVLKSQLDTPKWNEIIMRKLNNDYYKPFPHINLNLFPRLDDARGLLLRFIEDSRETDQLDFAKAYKATELAVRITHLPKVNYARGRFAAVEISSFDDMHVKIQDRDGQSPEVSDIILAQVNPIKPSPFTPEVMKQMNQLMAQKSLSLEAGIDKIIVKSSEEILVLYKNGEVKALDNIDTKDVPLPKGHKLEPGDFFKLNQILGASLRNEELSFTLRQPIRVYLGTIRFGMRNGKRVITIHQRDGAEVTIPFDEAAIDPLQREDFQ